jgi:hypothetical protein
MEIRNPSFTRERRRYRRFELSLAMAYQWGMTKDTLRTVDLSLGGVKIQTDIPIPIDERFDLTILLGNEAIKPTGKVVRSDPSLNRKYDVGICFESLSQQCLKRLERFLHGIILKGDQAKQKTALAEFDLTGLESNSFTLDKLRGNFLKWLHKSYPVDYQRYAHRPIIGENDIYDFLKSKGIDKVNIYYLIKSLRSV